MSIWQSMADWAKCFICQKKTKEKLRSTDEGRKSLESLLPKFSTKNALSFDMKRIQVKGQDLKRACWIARFARLHTLPITDTCLTRRRVYVPLPSSIDALRDFVLLEIPLCLSTPMQKSLIWLKTTMDTSKYANFQF